MRQLEHIIYLIDLKKYELALQEISDFSSEFDGEGILSYFSSLCWFALADLSKAKEFVEHALSQDPESNIYKFLLVRIYLRLSNLNQSYGVLKSLEPEGDNDLEEYFELWSLLELSRENLREAYDYCEKILALNPENVASLGMRGYIEILIYDSAQAKKTINRALALDPLNEMANYAFVFHQLIENDFIASEVHILNSLSFDPTNQLYLNGLRFVLMSKNSFSRAILKFRFFIAGKHKSVNLANKILFRIVLIAAAFSLIFDDSFYWYVAGFLIAVVIGFIPFKTIPMSQNLFLLNSRFRTIVIRNEELLFSAYSFVMLISGLYLLLNSMTVGNMYNTLIPGLLACFNSGLPHDRYYGIRKEHKTAHLFILFCSNLLFILLFVLDEGGMILHLFILGLLFVYQFWKRHASINAVIE